MAMRTHLHKAVQVATKILMALCAIAILWMVISLILIGWNELSRARHLDRLRSETQLPGELTTLGQHPLTAIFLPTEERICVLHPYTGNRGIAEMSRGQKQAIQSLELPSEEWTWYVVAFHGDHITRVLLVDETVDAKLASESRCFESGDSGLIRVQKQSSDSSSIPRVELITKE